MRSKLFVTGLTIALGFMTPIVSSIGFPEIAVAQTVDPRKVEADRLWQQGKEQFKGKQFKATLQSWQQALKLYGEIQDRRGEGNALRGLGNAHDSLGNYRKAIEYYKEILTITHSLKDRYGESELLARLGKVYSVLGNHIKASNYYEEGLSIARDIKNLPLEQWILNNLSQALLDQEQRLSIARELKDRVVEGNLIVNLGLIYQSLGNSKKAIQLQLQSLEISQKTGSKYTEGNALRNLGNIYLNLADYRKAIEYFEKSLLIARKTKNRSLEVAIVGDLGDSYYFISDYNRAIYNHEINLKMSREIADRREESRSLRRIGVSYHEFKAYKKAILYHKQSLVLSRHLEDRHEEGASLGNLGLAYYELGNYAQAIQYHEQDLSISRETKNRDGEQIALNNLGVSLTQREPELAIVFYKQSISIAESIRKENRTLSRELQEFYTKTVAGTYRRLADLLLSQGRVLEAQQVLELLKVQELRDFTKDTRYGGTDDRNLLNPPEKNVTKAFDDKIKLGDRLTQCEQTKCSDRSQLIAQVTQANETFEQTAKRLKAALKSQESKDPAQLQNEEFTRNAQNIILNNPRKTVLLYPLVLDDKLWLVWGSQAGKTGIVFDSKEISVTRKELSTQVLELSELLKTSSSDPKKIQRISQQLYQWLIQPIRQQLTDNGIQNIVFSLDRATRYIPMAVLHDGNQYLIENFTLSTILTTQTDTTDKLAPTPTENPVLGLGVTQAIGSFSALPAVQSELDSIRKIFPGITRFNQDFTETALRENIPDHRILHIATHGSFRTNPADSFILLGNGKELKIPAIESMKNLAGTHLVVLSACETGKGGIDTEGMEVAGLGHYFLRGGAKSVMASLWLVNDPATALLMRDFYSHLATGKLTKAEALRQTQLAFLKGDRNTDSFKTLPRRSSEPPLNLRLDMESDLPKNSLAHPYYWAPFILIGNNL